MKKISIIVIATAISACNPTQETKIVDSRPKDEIEFIDKISKIKDDYSTNSVQLDAKVDSFNGYVYSKLKNITNWVVVVNDINESPIDANSTAKRTEDLNTIPIYNLKVYATIKNYDKPDPRLDSLNIPQADVVYLTATIPKNINTSLGKQLIGKMKNINRFDTILVSGTITHLDENLKPNFKELFKSGDWNVDLMPTDIRKK